MGRRAKEVLVAVAISLLLLVGLPLGCALRKRDYIDDNMAILEQLPVYPGARERYTDEDSEYRDTENPLEPPDGWSTHRTYLVPRGVRMRQVLAFYETELRRGWLKQNPIAAPAPTRRGKPGSSSTQAGSTRATRPPTSTSESTPTAPTSAERRLVGCRALASGVAQILGRVLDGVRDLFDRARYEPDALPQTSAADVRESRQTGQGNDQQAEPAPISFLAAPQHHRVCGKPRSTWLVAGSGQRDVTTFPRV